MFVLGKLYRILRTRNERGLPFKAGNLHKAFYTTDGGVDYEITQVEDESILMFVGVKAISIPLCEENECYVFLYDDRFVMFKKSDVHKRNFFHKIRI